MCGGFLGKIVDAGGDAVRAVTKPVTQLASKIPGGDIIAPAALALTGNPLAAAAFTGASSYNKTGNFLPSLGAGVGSYFGGQLGGTEGAALGMEAGGRFGDAGIALGAGLGQGIGSGLGGQLGGDLGAGLTSAAGEIAGLGGAAAGMGGASLADSILPQEAPISRLAPGEGNYSLGDAFGGLDEKQRRSLIATQGVYGQGADKNQEDYLVRSTNQRLLNEDMSQDPYDLMPIEEQFFMSQGYNFNPGDTNSLLKSFQRRGYA